MARFSINYDNILARIEEVSTIDTEPVQFVKVTKIPCPDCTYDPVTKSSSNPFCPTCDGSGTTEELEKTEIIASVSRVTGAENYFEPGGRLQKGAVVMTVHETELTGAGYDMESDWFTVFDWVEIGGKGKRYKMAENDDAIPQTLQGHIYEILFHLTLIKTQC
jgi:excinuclease UvrABC ATPase subunit